jgi:short subunit dehydrogenase-like uncharacterized protein
MPAPEFDLIVWGATGFTGRLVAASVAATAPPGLRWALGGRDAGRLEAVRASCGGGPGLVVGDAHDPASMAAMARRTRVVATTVGPYARHGMPLLAACVAAGTHYADVTGEVPWMRRSIDAFHRRASANGTRVLHACGFDSMPSDLGVWLLQRAARERHGRPCETIDHVFGPMAGGGVSGGSVASMLALLDDARADAPFRRGVADPDLLAPGAAPSARIDDPWWPERDPWGQRWTAPFPMAQVNERVVRRTRALLGEPWGAGFRYRERWFVGGWARAAAIGAATRLGPPLLMIGPLRRAVEARWLPRPGAGPNASARARGYFRSTLVGRIDGLREPVVVRVASDLDPAYDATAVMLREAALCLVLDDARGAGGVSTPAAAFAALLIERLGRAGIHLTVEGDPAR